MRAIMIGTGVALCLAATGAGARARHVSSGGSGVPNLNVRGSCLDAQKFSGGTQDNKNLAFKGCMQDESNAKAELDKRWSSFKPRERRDCVEQGRDPSPSYVEILTCVEMNSGSMRNAPRIDGKRVPQIGGPVAPGLGGPVPKT